MPTNLSVSVFLWCAFHLPTEIHENIRLLQFGRYIPLIKWSCLWLFSIARPTVWTHVQVTSETRLEIFSSDHWKRCFLHSISVPSALKVVYDMHSINWRFNYILSYLLTVLLGIWTLLVTGHILLKVPQSVSIRSVKFQFIWTILNFICWFH